MNNLIPTPNILDRAAGQITLQFRNDPDILGYRIRVSNSLTNAYGTDNGLAGVGTVNILDVQRGQAFISRVMRQRKTAILGDTTRGQTRAIYDPTEFVGVAATVPPDNQLAFMRVQVRTVGAPAFPVAADNTNQSVILVVQDPQFSSVSHPTLTLSGLAPTLGAALAGLPAPAGALVFRVPGFGESMWITNHEAAGGNPLFFATGFSQPLARIDPATAIMHQGGMRDELVICAAVGTPAFSILMTCAVPAR
jgi:hypothetical protein